MTLALVLVSALLRPCGDASPWYCGHLLRPLDPSGTIRASIGIHFEWLEHRNGNARSEGVIVANEGGPGSGSTGSREAYRALFSQILSTRDLLLVDNRGTGASGAIDCEPLQSEPVMPYADIAACADQLGDSAQLYGTGLAADDLAAILDALQIKKIDLYGDSYGTFFVQTFAGRHPDRVLSMILDGAFPVTGDSPWYETAAAAMRQAYNAVCRRAAACMHLSGTSMDRIGALVEALRARHDAKITPSMLATVMDASGLATVPYRELDAAARAYVGGDAVPLARLVRESYAVNEVAGSATTYSRGLFVAVSCADYPQAYDMTLDLPARRIEWNEARDKMRKDSSDVYAPFTIDEWLGMAPDYATVKLCLHWPALSSVPYPPGQPVPLNVDFPDAPVLVLSGDLDTITTADEGAAAAELFPNATQLIQVNGAHVAAIGDPYDCASRIARAFVVTLKIQDAGCLKNTPEIRMVSMFAVHVRDMTPALGLSTNSAGQAQLRAASVAAQTVGDALARTSWLQGISGQGLRGGSYRVSSTNGVKTITLDAYRWTDDVPITGVVTENQRTGDINGTVALTGASHGTVVVQWNERRPSANALISGRLDGRRVYAAIPAP